MSANEICILLWLVGMSWVVRLEGTVNCSTACKKCKEKVEHSDLLEIYCAMCHECKNRRRQGRADYRGSYEVRRYPEEESAQNYEEECPTPPPCEQEYDDYPVKLKTTADTTTTTTTRRPCPPAAECKKRRHPKRMCCLPMCGYPVNCPGLMSSPPHPPQPLTQAATRRPRQRQSSPSQTPSSSQPLPPSQPTTNPDYYYVHIGVPKELV